MALAGAIGSESVLSASAESRGEIFFQTNHRTHDSGPFLVLSRRAACAAPSRTDGKGASNRLGYPAGTRAGTRASERLLGDRRVRPALPPLYARTPLGAHGGALLVLASQRMQPRIRSVTLR